MPRRTRLAEGGPAIFVTLKSYLGRLEEQEKTKPEDQRRNVPSISELANDVGVSATAIYDIASGDVKQLNLQIAGRLIIAMRQRGFPMEITDLLALRE